MSDTGNTTLQEALVVALAAMPNPVKNAENPAFKRDGKPLRYADLEATLDACRPVLAANGIAVMQMPVNGEGASIGVRTVLIGHGEQMDCGTFFLPLPKPDPQGVGSAITYARRYALTALFGLAQEDDDANGACTQTAPGSPAPAAQATPTPSKGLASEKQVGMIYSLAHKLGWTDEYLSASLRRSLGKAKPEELTGGRGGEASKMIEYLIGEVDSMSADEPHYEETTETPFDLDGPEIPF
ncbi:MAG: ERF family protein [Coriobacteriales bacterium]